MVSAATEPSEHFGVHDMRRSLPVTSGRRDSRKDITSTFEHSPIDYSVGAPSPSTASQESSCENPKHQPCVAAIRPA